MFSATFLLFLVEDEEIDTEALIREMERHVSLSDQSQTFSQGVTDCRISQMKTKYNWSVSKSSGPFLCATSETKAARPSETYDHAKDTEQFYNVTREFLDGMKRDSSIVGSYDVKMVNKVLRPQMTSRYLRVWRVESLKSGREQSVAALFSTAENFVIYRKPCHETLNPQTNHSWDECVVALSFSGASLKQVENWIGQQDSKSLRSFGVRTNVLL